MYKLTNARIGMHNKFKNTKGFSKYKYLIFLAINNIINEIYLRLIAAKAAKVNTFIFTGANFIL
jgi:hypothetical protein